MLSRLGIEASQAAQYVVAFAIILVLVALFGLVLRRLAGGRLVLPGQDRARARQPRLGIVDIYDLDRQRQLILLRRDNVEHLLLIGGPNDVVIETNIVRVPGARLSPVPGEFPAERPEPSFERPPEAPRPQVEPPARPSVEAQLAARLGAMAGRPSETSDMDQERAPVGSAGAPAPARVEPALKPDTVAPTPAPPTRTGRIEPALTPSRPAPVPPPPPVEPPPVRPEPRPAAPPVPPLSPRPVPPPRQTAGSEPEPARPTPPPPAPEPTRPAAAEPRSPDAGVLSDMAKQLEEALKRPIAPAAPQPSPQPPAPRKPEPEEDDLLVPPSPPGPRFGAPAAPPAQTTAPAEPLRPAPEPARPAPPPPPAAPRTAPTPPPPSQPARAVEDPFSVEEIEAEFARLLGRPVDKKDKT